MSRRRRRLVEEDPPPQGGTNGEVRRRVVTVDPMNEMIVIAGAVALWDNEDQVGPLFLSIDADHFQDEKHAAIWAAFVEMRRQRLEYDPETVRAITSGKADIRHLAGIVNNRPEAPPNLDFHVDLLEWDKQRAEAARGPVSELLDVLEVPQTPPERVRQIAKNVADAFSSGNRSILRDPSEVAREQSAVVEARVRGQAVWPYGVDGLDRDEQDEPRLVPGAAPGQMTILTAVPRAGKTTVGARIALAQIEAGRRVLLGPWEPGAGMSVEMLACMRLGYNLHRVRTGALDDDELRQLQEEMSWVGDHVEIMRRPVSQSSKDRNWDNDAALDRVHEAIVLSGADFAIFDLWKRMLKYTDPADEESALVRQQAILQETRCHGLLLSQLRVKDVEQRQDRRPTLDAIKGSAAYVEVPDTIIGLDRPWFWKRLDEDSILDLYVLKQRYGVAPIAVSFDWDGSHGRISNGKTTAYDPPGVESRADKAIRETSGGKNRKKQWPTRS